MKTTQGKKPENLLDKKELIEYLKTVKRTRKLLVELMSTKNPDKDTRNVINMIMIRADYFAEFSRRNKKKELNGLIKEIFDEMKDINKEIDEKQKLAKIREKNETK